MTRSPWRLRGSRYLFESPWFRLRQDDLTLPHGEEITYSVIEHDGWVIVLPLLEDGRVVMERVYRHTLARALLECPSGGRDGQSPDLAARRELEEETGYRARDVLSLGRFHSSTGISNEWFEVFLATGLSADGVVSREATEEIETLLVPFAELLRMARAGEIEHAPSALAILLAAPRLRA
jgi:8-oxo-dGTP pyrophosphatase MutT (NUDIX family)